MYLNIYRPTDFGDWSVSCRDVPASRGVNLNYQFMKKKWKNGLLGEKKRSFSYSLMCCLLILVLPTWVSCDENETVKVNYNPDLPVKVVNIEPATGGIMTPVVIQGSNFGTDKTKVQVLFNGKPGVVVNVVNEYIYALVPKCEGGDTEIKVVVDGKNEGLLQDLSFNYIVSSKVTTLAADYTDNLGYMIAIGIDDQENLVICEQEKVRLYSILENKLVDIMSMDGISLVGGCFSRDYRYYCVLPRNPRTAAVILLDKKSNWNREMIFDSEEVMKDLSYSVAITVDDQENIFIYGMSTLGGALVFKINRDTRKITKVGKLNVTTGTFMSYNPKDKHIYMSLSSSHQIIKFDSQKEELTENDWEVVTGKAGEDTGKDGILSEATLGRPQGLEFDDDNNLYVACSFDQNIKRIDLDEGKVTTIAGGTMSGYADGDAASARFTNPVSVAVTREGIVYVLEYRSANPNVGWELIKRLRCVAIQ